MDLREIFAQFERYGSLDSKLLEALQVLTDVNDDMHHGRHPALIVENICKVRTILDRLQYQICN